ncbi:hypothetical protein HWV62_45430 [Athelia sp. TMB]|nr:hypothetical protein HWV62_45430 [Athelia sp. TMB]
MVNALTHDFSSSPDQLLTTLLPYVASGGTDYTSAIQNAQGVMERNWSTESKALSFHSVSFGPDRASPSLRRMAQIALEAQNNAPRDPLMPAAAMVLSSYSEALDSVRLAETFLGIADSLKKPRGSLLR